MIVSITGIVEEMIEITSLVSVPVSVIIFLAVSISWKEGVGLIAGRDFSGLQDGVGVIVTVEVVVVAVVTIMVDVVVSINVEVVVVAVVTIMVEVVVSSNVEVVVVVIEDISVEVEITVVIVVDGI